MTVYLVYLRNIIIIIIIITEYIFVASLVSYFHDCFTAGLFDWSVCSLNLYSSICLHMYVMICLGEAVSQNCEAKQWNFI